MFELSEIKKNLTWEQAMDYAKELGEGWVVPTGWQLKLMYEAKTLGHPDLQNMNGLFWSSSTYVSITYIAWGVHFDYGNVYSVNKLNSYDVRCVRVGPNDFLDLAIWVFKRKQETD